MKVIIIGAGIAGTCLALSLKRHNIPSIVYELRQKDSRDGGFLALAPNALRVLDHLGLYEKLSPLGYSYEDMHFLSARNLGYIGTVLNGSQERYGYKALRIPRGAVRWTLLDALREQDITVVYGSKCTSLEESDEGVTVTFSDGRTDTASLVIGTDGIHSRVRQYLSHTVQPTFSGQMGIGGIMARSELHPSAEAVHMPCIILGKTNSFALMPCTQSGDRVGFFATVEVEDRSRDAWTKLDEDKATQQQMLKTRHCNSDWPVLVSQTCEHADAATLTIWPFYKLPALESWMTPSKRVVVIGDAAHAMPPTGGQGAAMALEDALSLSDAIATASGMDEPGQNLTEWQTRRQERVKRVLEFTSRGGDMRRASPSALQQIIKEWAMWLYFKWVGKDAGLAWLYGGEDSLRRAEQDRS